MAFREVSTQGWGGRLGGSIMGALVGVVMFLAAFPVLWWNEGRAVQTELGLAEGSKAVVEANADQADPANNGRLIHVTAKAVTEDTPADPDFGVKAPKQLRLARKAEMFQYKEESHTETKKNLGGSETTVTTYTYPRVWSEDFQDSSHFHDPEYQGKNPSSMPYKSASWPAKKVTAGAYTLSPGLVSQIHDEKPLPIDSADAAKPPKGFAVRDGEFYKGKDPDAAEIGDMRVSYTVVEPTTVSVVARQEEGGALGPYQPKAGPPLEMLKTGEHDAASMFKEAEEQNKTLTWVLRAVGFFVMAVGIFLVLRPMAVLGDVVPFIGNMVGGLLAVVAGLIALGLSLITISIAWLFYRPLIGVPLLIAGIGGLALVFWLVRRRRAPAVDAAA
jgi:Transmembrane protein 43